MRFKQAIIYFIGVFVLTFVVSAIVTLLFALTLHGASTIDWDLSFRNAILFGIMFSWMEIRRSKEKQ